MTNQYKHLSQYAVDLLDSTPQERIHSIRQGRFIEYGAVRQILSWVERRMDAPRTERSRYLIISAEAGAGKTSILEYLQRCFSDAPDQSGPPYRPIIRCCIGPQPGIGSLQRTLLEGLGDLTPEWRQSSHRNACIKRRLQDLQTRILCFDEAEHLLNMPPHHRSALQDWIRWVSNDAQVDVIYAGAHAVEFLAPGDPYLINRVDLVELPRWTVGADLGSFLRAFERSLPLRRPSRLWGLPMQRALINESRGLHTGGGITYGIVQIIEAAAITAIATKREQIDRALLGVWREPAQTVRRLGGGPR